MNLRDFGVARATFAEVASAAQVIHRWHNIPMTLIIDSSRSRLAPSIAPTQGKVDDEDRQNYPAVNRYSFARIRSPQVQCNHQYSNGYHQELHASREGTPTVVHR